MKHYNKLTTSINASILLSQSLYWFGKMDRPYYKFLSPCEHPVCRIGQSDSWVEDLGFSVYQVKSSIKLIGTKLKSDTSYDLRDCNLLLYWRTGNNVTYYCPNYFLMQSLDDYRGLFEKDFPHFEQWLSHYQTEGISFSEKDFFCIRDLKYLFSIKQLSLIHI